MEIVIVPTQQDCSEARCHVWGLAKRKFSKLFFPPPFPSSPKQTYNYLLLYLVGEWNSQFTIQLWVSEIGKCLLLMATQTQNLLSKLEERRLWSASHKLPQRVIEDCGDFALFVSLRQSGCWPEHSAQYEASRGVKWNNQRAESDRIAKTTLHFSRLTLLCSCYVEVTTHPIWAAPTCQASCWGVSLGFYHLILFFFF